MIEQTQEHLTRSALGAPDAAIFKSFSTFYAIRCYLLWSWPLFFVAAFLTWTYAIHSLHSNSTTRFTHVIHIITFGQAPALYATAFSLHTANRNGFYNRPQPSSPFGGSPTRSRSFAGRIRGQRFRNSATPRSNRHYSSPFSFIH